MNEGDNYDERYRWRALRKLGRAETPDDLGTYETRNAGMAACDSDAADRGYLLAWHWVLHRAHALPVGGGPGDQYTVERIAAAK